MIIKLKIRRNPYKNYNRLCKIIIAISICYIVCVGVFNVPDIEHLLDKAEDRVVSAREFIKGENDELPFVDIEKNNESIMVVINDENLATIKKEEIISEQLAGGFDPLGGTLTKVQQNKLNKNRSIIENLKKEKNATYLINNFFSVDSTTSVTEDMMNPNKLLSYKIATGNKNKKENIILIYHTHSSESYSDSVKGNRSDTIVGVGDYLTELLEEKGYTVIHDTTAYDVKNGKWNRESYDTALPSLKKYIKENPGIIVTIDLHRNSGNEKAVTIMNGVNVAQIMLFNGVSRNKNGQRVGLENKNLQGNLAFSLRLLMCSMEKYPDFAKKTYIKGYRYNLHLVPRALLVEVGNDKNTVAEAKAAMVPFADILDEVLTGKY